MRVCTHIIMYVLYAYVCVHGIAQKLKRTVRQVKVCVMYMYCMCVCMCGCTHASVSFKQFNVM